MKPCTSSASRAGAALALLALLSACLTSVDAIATICDNTKVPGPVKNIRSTGSALQGGGYANLQITFDYPASTSFVPCVKSYKVRCLLWAAVGRVGTADVAARARVTG